MVEIVPAILVKTKEEFEQRITSVAPYVSRVQIDIMDGKFVPNATLPVEEFSPIPKNLLVEYHLMVQNPLEYVKRIGKKGAIYELHIESLANPQEAISEIKRMGGRVALAISPDTPVSAVEPFLPQIEHVLVMTVYPGFSGQSYLPAMEEKMRKLRELGVVVEVDGGIVIGTAKRAAAAGATLIGAASAIFSKPDIKSAIEGLKADAEG
ncbi:MAG: ribulose-phosphate 3-epimerase [Candidatus Micrarchaeota archaeon]|nr:ribulose-phosphate 3-epimerase [Candidatus Micrarchaeota archaeon]